jgi:hypothetical protein
MKKPIKSIKDISLEENLLPGTPVRVVEVFLL